MQAPYCYCFYAFMAAISSLNDYGSDSSNSAPDNEDQKEDLPLHLTSLDFETMKTFPSTSMQIIAAPVVVTKVCNCKYMYLPYPTLQFSEEWARGRKLMACLTP